MTYFVIGLMSGSAHDGLDICYTHITYVSGRKWEYKLEHTTCIPYPPELRAQLKNAAGLSVPEFLRLNTAYGRFCAEAINKFIEQHDLEHKVFFIASHGHTAWHEPAARVSTQIGDGATIAALTGYTTISDLRNMDIALGGQGAPIVPIADRFLFSDYDFCLNLGGIANVTVNKDEPIAFDVCPANQLLDFFARKKGLEYDKGGALAGQGICNDTILGNINSHQFYSLPAPKSLSNAFSETEILPTLAKEPEEDALRTAVKHIAFQIARAITPYCGEADKEYKMMLTGGGALNAFLVNQIKQEIEQQGMSVSCEVPDENLVKYKEALAMALLGVLRWREEENVLSSATGASRNSIGGAVWLGA